MPRGLAFTIGFGSLVLIGMTVFSGLVLLKACALDLPLLRHVSSCVSEKHRTVDMRIVALAQERGELERRVFEIEREIGALQCVAASPDPNAPLTPEGWANGDLSMLFGCWALDATYRSRDVATGQIRTYREWSMCFDSGGNGEQTMRSDDGVSCEGSVRAGFSGGVLQILEPGNLSCDDGGYIHQREITCRLTDGGKAVCDTLQPETRGAAQVGFQRAP